VTQVSKVVNIAELIYECASCNQFFQMLIRDSPLQKQLGPAFKQMMCERLNHNEELIKQLVPEWELGCRRLTPGPGYLEALQSSNCSFSTSPIVRITEKGIETDEGVEEFDIIICATGFDASCKPYFNVTGRDGISLSKVMENNPQAYFGICNANVPNYFSFTSANSPVGQGSFFAGMEWAASYILQWVKKIATEDIR
jgi:cation diffusion facilitator CzcD-associated flavoprotein CzcO